MGLICTPYGYSGAARVSGVSYQGIILADNPVAYWPLNETSGTVAHDLSGNGINGTITGGVTLGENGIPSAPGAFLFDGSSGYITVPEAAQLALSSQGSVEAWGFPNPSTTSSDILGIGSSSGYYNNGYRPRLTNLEPDFVYAAADQLTAPSAVSTSGFSHIVFTFNASGASQIYVNGALVASGGADYSYSAGSPVGGAIGAYLGNGTVAEFWNGKLCNIGVYPSVLTAAQILNHYNAGIGA